MKRRQAFENVWNLYGRVFVADTCMRSYVHKHTVTILLSMRKTLYLDSLNDSVVVQSQR